MKKIYLPALLSIIALLFFSGLAKAANEKNLDPRPNSLQSNIAQDVESRKEKIDEKKNEMDDKKEEKLDQRLEKGIERALAALDKRIKSLENLRTRMTERMRIREQEREMINDLIDDMLTQIKTEREQVENAGDLEALKNQFKNSIEKTHIYAITIPKIRAYALTSAAYNGLDRIEKVFTKIEELIAKMSDDDKTAAQEFYNKAKAETASAKDNIDKALAEFKKMNPSGDPTTARASLEAGKTYLKQAREELKNTVEYLKQIRELTKKMIADDANEEKTTE
jgi:hypothetical protein